MTNRFRPSAFRLAVIALTSFVIVAAITMLMPEAADAQYYPDYNGSMNVYGGGWYSAYYW